jgi:hypothetical protein
MSRSISSELRGKAYRKNDKSRGHSQLRQIQLILPGIIIFLACYLLKESLIIDINQLPGFPVKIPFILALWQRG